MPILTQSQAKERLKEKGFLLKSDYPQETINGVVPSRQKLKVTCKNGHDSFMDLHAISEGRPCQLCTNNNPKNKLTHDQAVQFFFDRGFHLLSQYDTTGHYKYPSESPMLVKCFNGHEQVFSLAKVREYRTCLVCKEIENAQKLKEKYKLTEIKKED